MAIPVFEYPGDKANPPCDVCGSEDSITHTFHPDYPGDLERLLVARGWRGERLIELIKEHGDFERDPHYILPGLDADGLPTPALVERRRRLTPEMVRQAIARFDARADEVRAGLRAAEAAAERGEIGNTRLLVGKAQEDAQGMTHEFRGLWD